MPRRSCPGHLLWPRLTAVDSRQRLPPNALSIVAVGSGGDSSAFALALSPTPITSFRPHIGQLSPDKNMNFQCTTAAFTLSRAPGGFRHVVLTHPGTRPSMRFLSVGSHLCARASSRQVLANLPLPSASSYICPHGGHYRYSYRGLAPHQFMPMPGVHKALQPTPKSAPAPLAAPFLGGAAELGR